MSTYPGNSPQKELARKWAYDQVDQKKLLSKANIIIPSKDCGDVNELIGRGCLPNNLFAADIDPFAVQEAKNRGCQARKCRIEDLVYTLSRHNECRDVASVNVDLCNTIHKGIVTLNSVLSTLHSVRWKGTVLFTFAVGYKDGFCSDAERVRHLNENVFSANNSFNLNNLYRYQSTSANSCGSPMALIVMHISNQKIACVGK